MKKCGGNRLGTEERTELRMKMLSITSKQGKRERERERECVCVCVSEDVGLDWWIILKWM